MPDGPCVVRSAVDPRSSYQDYREELRWDFYFSCGYCTLAETEARAVGFEIDHYRPQRTHPDLESAYENLIWSCRPCNRQKGGFSPNADDSAVGRVVLRPDEHDFRDHLEIVDDELEGRTVPGRWTIELLGLNRNALVRLRRLRARYGLMKDVILNGLRELGRARIDFLPPGERRYLLRLRDDLEDAEKSLRDSWSRATREYLKSPFLEPSDDAHTRRRRRELKDLNAILPDEMLDDRAT